MKRLVLIFCLLSIAGCAGNHGPIGVLPLVSSLENAGEIYILRNDDAYDAYNFTIALDDIGMFGISLNEYTKFKVEHGRHSLSVICKGRWSSRQKPVNVEPGKVYYFMVRAHIPCAVIEPMTEQKAKEFMSAAKYISITP